MKIKTGNFCNHDLYIVDDLLRQLRLQQIRKEFTDTDFSQIQPTALPKG